MTVNFAKLLELLRRLMDYLLIANLITRQNDQRLIEERCSPVEPAAGGGTGAALPYSVMKSRALLTFPRIRTRHRPNFSLAHWKGRV
jgi:hypothetical protein